MTYLIGMDGGGTKTKCVVTDENLNLLFEDKGNASNFLIQGVPKVSQMVVGLIKKLISELKIKDTEIGGFVIGTTGAGRRIDAETLESGILEALRFENINIKKIRVESDARVALEGAFAGKPGSILIAGTGSIMFGKDKFEEIFRVGGFGRFIGDEGSGYSIGKRGLITLSKYFDGRGNYSLLKELVSENFAINDTADLITEIYKNNFDIASIAPLVIESAEKGDELCNKILDDESDELILHVISMYEKLNEDFMNLSLVGGIITTDNYYAGMFKNKINKLGYIKIVEPVYEPAIGAALMAKNLTK
ncbi:MAG: BadF/BadG/BcrA/BcrD ATPase family protein [bacterium]